MAKTIKCNGCGRKRVPFLGSRGRPTKYCKECKGGNFWTSAFGQWFLDAASRQSKDSMPLNDNDIEEIHQLWLRRRRAQGTRYIISMTWDYGDDPFGIEYEPKRVQEGKWESDYTYHLCHLDPVTGDGFQGRLTANNLVIAPAKINQSLGNSQVVDHGFRVYNAQEPFKDKQQVKSWSTKMYDIAAIAQRLKLKPKSNEAPQSDLWLSSGSTSPSEVFVDEINRLGGNWSANHTKNPAMAFEQLLKIGIQNSPYIEFHYGEYIDWEAEYEKF
ncbi:hypothetical protein NDJ06_19365 [Vibrio alginolyticus]|uniref:hypothetical protein n=1 Tax=Vibrio alginolyticus TaxID=663 RepID=UPI00215EC2AA|nr:hypothetical protein [Vibrio alginolyticus]MCS0187465.1 hypothetical protein [Vibrio alginolyticus]